MTTSACIALFIIAAVVLSPIAYAAYAIWKAPDIDEEDQNDEIRFG